MWAGPYAGMLLASLGAEVIKVEGHRRSDLTRRSVIWPIQEPAPIEVPPNQGLAFNTVNMNKKGLAVDLSRPEGVEVARRLARVSDVVVDNMRPGAMVGLGLGWEDLRKVRADLVVATSSGRGFSGPEKNYLGFASVHQAIGGGAYVTGYADDAPCHSGGDVDLMNAMTLALAIVAALHHRARTGEGQFIDYSQCEGASALVGEQLLAYQMTGQVPERMGNAHPSSAPHAVYRAWGVDRWVAIEVHDDAAFARLAAAIGQPGLAGDPRFASRAARKANEEALDAILAGWIRRRDRDTVVTTLEAAGVAAAPVRDGRDLYADRHLRERGAFVKVRHPELGELELVRAPVASRCGARAGQGGAAAGRGRRRDPRRAPRLWRGRDRAAPLRGCRLGELCAGGAATALVALARDGGHGRAPRPPPESGAPTSWPSLSLRHPFSRRGRDLSRPRARAPVEILIDRWGVPHIYAGSEDDVFLAQGWNAARDRLWQLDLWKRRGDGTLSEVFGPEYVAKDRAARLLLYRGDLRDEWIAYAGDTKRIVSSFVAGINAYVALTEERADLLPPEFRALDYRPARWTPETVVAIRSHGLLRNAKAELKRAIFLRRFGASALALRDHYEPAHELEVPAGLDLTVFDDDTLTDYDLGTGAVSFAALLDEATAAGAEGEGSAGSNNWAIAAVANDHRTTDPRQRSASRARAAVAALSGPPVVAAPRARSEPASPRCRRIARPQWSRRVRVHHLRHGPGRPLRAEHARARWRNSRVPRGGRLGAHDGSARARRGPRRCRGARRVLRFTRYGPVLAEDPARGVAIALRAAWLEPGMAPYLASLELQRVRDWDGFLAALNRWGLPGENLVYADTTGVIGWKPAGRVPVRPGWDGLLPVPGGGRYEWPGYLDGDALPVESNPARGWVASANQMNLPPGYQQAVGYEWAPPYRYERIAEALSARERWSVEDAARLQTDYVSMPARWLVERLKTIGSRSEVERRALALLRDWDCRLDAGSPAAALFEIWLRRHLPAAVWGRVARARISMPTLRTSSSRRQFQPCWRCSSRATLPGEEVTAALLDPLGAAVAEVEERLGADWRAWRWGALHHPLRSSAGGSAPRQARHRDRDRTAATPGKW